MYLKHICTFLFFKPNKENAEKQRWQQDTGEPMTMVNIKPFTWPPPKSNKHKNDKLKNGTVYVNFKWTQ